MAWPHLSCISQCSLLHAWWFSLSHPHYPALHLTLHTHSHSFTNVFLVYISFIISFATSLVQVCTSCIQQGNTRRTRMASYLKQLNVGEAYCVPASAIIPVGCWACHVNFSEMVTKFVFLIRWLYWSCEGKFAKVPGYIRNQHEIPCDLFRWHVRLSALKIQALAVPDRENLDLHTTAHQPSCMW